MGCFAEERAFTRVYDPNLFMCSFSFFINVAVGLPFDSVCHKVAISLQKSQFSCKESVTYAKREMCISGGIFIFKLL